MNGPEKCLEARDPSALLAYLQGDLPPEELRELEDHLRVCPFCSVELAALRSVDLLLRTHPESFHPDADELYAFVAGTEDPASRIAKHLETCSACADDARILREEVFETPGLARTLRELPPSLRARLEQMHGIRERQTLRRDFAARIADILRHPLRFPVFALGTAAAVVILAVMVIPTWETLKYATKPPMMPSQVETKDVGRPDALLDKDGRAPDQKVSREEVLGEVRKRRDAAADEVATVPAGPPTDALERALSAGKGAKVEDDSSLPMLPAPAPAAPPFAPQYGAPASVEKEVFMMRKPERAHAPARKAAPPAEGPAPPGETSPQPGMTMPGSPPVEVSLVGPDGTPFTEFRFTPTRSLEDRYRFIPEPIATAKGKRFKQDAAGRRQSLEKSTDSSARVLRILIVIEKGGEGYAIRGTILDSPSAPASGVAVDSGIPHEALQERVAALVTKLLSDRPADAGRK
jgi:anti-sigma factor RsiW